MRDCKEHLNNGGITPFPEPHDYGFKFIDDYMNPVFLDSFYHEHPGFRQLYKAACANILAHSKQLKEIAFLQL